MSPRGDGAPSLAGVWDPGGDRHWLQLLCLVGACFYVAWGPLYQALGFQDPLALRFGIGAACGALCLATTRISGDRFRAWLLPLTILMSLHGAYNLHLNHYSSEHYMGCFLLIAAIAVTFAYPLHLGIFGAATLGIYLIGLESDHAPGGPAWVFVGGITTLLALAFISLVGKRRMARRLETAHAQLAEQTYRLQLEIDSSPLGVAFDTSPMGIVMDDDGRIVLANPAFSEALRYPVDELQGMKLQDLEVGGSRTEFPNRTHEVLMRRKDGSHFAALVHGMRIAASGRGVRSLSFVEDITERKQHEQAIAFSAYHDTLTGLVNRTKFRMILEATLAETAEQGNDVAVMFLDLDNFKQVNDSLGHGVGDSLLQQVAVRVSAIVYPRGTVARLGGDEFTVVLPEVSLEIAEAFARQIIADLARPYELSPHEVRITASIGIAMAPAHALEPSGLMKAADLSLYEAKHKGKNRHAVYAATMQQVIMVRHAIENALHKAVQREELEVYYQPQIDLETGRVIGAEALLRWNHPERGLVFPGEFIPIAEETGLILPISQQVIRTVCLAVRQWEQQGLEPPRIALNLSARQIQTNHIVDSLKWELLETGASPQGLTVELTESTMVASRSRAIEVIRTMRELGVKTAVDDFGTGYSSLSYLKDFPLDILKIDRSFVADMHEPETLAIIQALLSLAASLGMEVVAEGIETETQRLRLLELGVRKGQGYLFAKAVTRERFTEMLAPGLTLGVPLTSPGA